MTFPLFLALRYLQPKRTIVSVITIFCVMGVMFGVGSLVVVISVMNGFKEKIREDLLKIDPHIAALPSDEPGAAAVGWREVAARLREQPQIAREVWAVIEAPATLQLEDAFGRKALEPVRIHAVEEERAGFGASLDIIAGSFDLGGDFAVIPEDLALKWGFDVGDRIVVQSFRNAEEALRMIGKWEDTPQGERGDAEKWFEEMKGVLSPTELEVSGIFRSRQHQLLVLAPLHIGAEMMAKGDAIDFLAVQTPDPLRVESFQRQLEPLLPPSWRSQTWYQRHGFFFEAVESERGMMYFLLSIMMVVAGFCIVVTLATVAIHKRKEIGVVRSLGARFSQVTGIFLSQGLIVGVLGTLAGLGGGLLVLAYRMSIKRAVQWLFGVEILNPQVYGVVEIPSDVRLPDLLIISGISLAVSTVAGVLPALMAAAQDPAKALRSE